MRPLQACGACLILPYVISSSNKSICPKALKSVFQCHPANTDQTHYCVFAHANTKSHDVNALIDVPGILAAPTGVATSFSFACLFCVCGGH